MYKDLNIVAILPCGHCQGEGGATQRFWGATPGFGGPRQLHFVNRRFTFQSYEGSLLDFKFPIIK